LNFFQLFRGEEIIDYQVGKAAGVYLNVTGDSPVFREVAADRRNSFF
jgi:hypothetical protein